MSFGLALLTVTLSGYLSLSYEILWFRIYGFVSGGRAVVFGVVLGVFLFGVAAGSFAAERYCGGRAAADARDGGATGGRPGNARQRSRLSVDPIRR